MMDLVRAFWQVLEKGERRRFLLTLALLLVSSLIQTLGVGSILPLMAVLSDPGIIGRNRWLHEGYTSLGFASDGRFLMFLGLCSLVAVVVSNLFLALNQWATVHLAASIQRRLECTLLEKYLRAPYVAHLRRSPSELKRNVLDETARFSGIASLGLQLAAACFIILCITGLFLAINPALSLLIGLLLGGGYGAVYLGVRRHAAKIGQERMEANLQRYRMADEGLGAFKEITLLQRTGWILKRYREATDLLTGTVAKQMVSASLPRYVIEVLGFGGLLTVALYLLANHADVRGAIPLIGVFAFGAYRMLPAMQGVYHCAVGLRFYAPVVGAMGREFAETAGERDGRSGAGEADPLAFEREITLKGVSFGFGGERGRVLEDVSLTVPCRGFVGIAGETGAGKSTLADIILGLLSPEVGEIAVDGTPLRGETRRRWQKLLGYVPQDTYLADDTIERNIAFGLPSEKIDPGAVRAAASLAQIRDFIETELPEGYQTVVGDRGVRLSGGQRQRIGIARALYHRPKVLVLDEATSMLDGETEARVFGAVETFIHDLTLIVVAHRLHTLKRADAIVLLEGGRVAARGTYSDLLERNERFKQMAFGLVP